MYTKGNLIVGKNGLVTVKSTDDSGTARNLIVVPVNLFPGLVAAIHLKLNHPSKYQMIKLIARYFFSPGSSAAINDCVNNCHTCLSLKPLPETIFGETITQTEEFGTRYSVDIMKRNTQCFIFIVELLTHYCVIKLLNGETADNVEAAILDSINTSLNQKGAVIRCDGASYFQHLKAKAEDPNSLLAKLSISFDLGQSYHKNKNPYAELAIKDGHVAINKSENPYNLTESDLILIARELNTKIRSGGYSSLELFLKRSSVDGATITWDDKDIADLKLSKKLHVHSPPLYAEHDFEAGDLVMIKSDKTKIKPRDIFLVQSIVERNGSYWAELFKFGKKLVNKPHLVKIEDLVKVLIEKRH